VSRAGARSPSKTLAAWLALTGGWLGLHRFYLHGWRDPWAWAFIVPSLVGVVGVVRMRQLGVDDAWAGLLVPWLGLSLTAATGFALFYGLTSDDRWRERHGDRANAAPSGWPTVFAVVLALFFGAGALMATIAFCAQQYFEHQSPAAAGRG
jgi:hypothetical protein